MSQVGSHTTTSEGAQVPLVPAAGQLPARITYFPFDESAPLVIPAAAWTHEGFRAWALSDDFPERGKLTFAGGELIIDMSPESIECHSEIKSEVARVLLTLVRERRIGRLHIDGILISHLDAGVSNEPDILFISRETQRSGRLQFTREKGQPQISKEVVGPVDWVLEIVSPSSRRKDKKVLRAAYFAAEIPEYWIIDALGDEIDFQVLVAGKDEYVAAVSNDGWQQSPTFSKAFRLVRERDEDELWEYTLEMQDVEETSSKK